MKVWKIRHKDTGLFFSTKTSKSQWTDGAEGNCYNKISYCKTIISTYRKYNNSSTNDGWKNVEIVEYDLSEICIYEI